MKKTHAPMVQVIEKPQQQSVLDWRREDLPQLSPIQEDAFSLTSVSRADFARMHAHSTSGDTQELDLRHTLEDEDALPLEDELCFEQPEFREKDEELDLQWYPEKDEAFSIETGAWERLQAVVDPSQDCGESELERAWFDAPPEAETSWDA